MGTPGGSNGRVFPGLRCSINAAMTPRDHALLHVPHNVICKDPARLAVDENV
jgi:hypothetical protein